MVKGTITKIAPFGAFARIEDGVEGLIHLSELPSGTQDPKQVLKEGEEVTVRILRIESERRRLGLSVRAAEEGAEYSPTEEETPSGIAVVEASESVAESAPTVTSPAAETPPESAARPRPQTPQREEAPTTAMAAAFAAALNQQRDQDEPTANGASAPATDTAAAAPEAPAAPVAASAAEVADVAEAPAEVTAKVTADEAPTEASAPEASTPEASTPEASTPEASTPEASTVDESAPVSASADEAPATPKAEESSTEASDAEAPAEASASDGEEA